MYSQGHYDGTPPKATSSATHIRCEEYVKDVLKNVNTIKYLVDAINKLVPESSAITPEKIKCISSKKFVDAFKVLDAKNNNNSNSNSNNLDDGGTDGDNSNPAPPPQRAGYMWMNSQFAKKGEIILLEDVVKEKDDVERAVRHELIHAYDDARGEIEPTNCYHHACSEVRAARLSGDCFIGEEIRRGRVGTVSGRDCVIRRATLAVENSPLCRGFGSRAVEVVMPRCYRDFAPYVAPPYVMGNAKGSPE